MEYYIKALEKLRPNASWSLRGDGYSGLEWLDNKQSKPTEDEIDDTIKMLNTEKIKAELEAKAKEAKQMALDTITVKVNGKIFDGNETARNNMLASIQASQLLNIESTYWKLADNSVQEVTLEEIKEALAKAIQRVGEIVTR